MPLNEPTPEDASAASRNYINVQDSVDGWTALHFAADNGHTETCRILLEYGADARIMSHDGKTAADLARQNGHIVTARLISSRL
mgnify:CR=1 FL=1